MTSEQPEPPSPVADARTLVRFVFALCLVAVAAAAFALDFRALLAFVFEVAYGKHDVGSAFDSLNWAQRLVLPACGGLLAGAVTRRAGQGVGDVMEAVVSGNVRLSMRVTLRKSLGSWLAITTGASA